MSKVTNSSKTNQDTLQNLHEINSLVQMKNIFLSGIVSFLSLASTQVSHAVAAEKLKSDEPSLIKLKRQKVSRDRNQTKMK